MDPDPRPALGDTPIAPRRVRSLAIVCTTVAVFSYIISESETDRYGNPHVLTPVQKFLKRLISSATHVSEEDASKIHAHQRQQSQEDRERS